MKALIIFLITINIFASELRVISKEDKGSSWLIDWIRYPPIIAKEQKTYIKNQSLQSNIVLEPNLQTSIMFLIDTSVPMKSAFDKGIRETILNTTKEINTTYHSISIVGFDRDLNIALDFNDTNKSVSDAFSQIQIKGQRTELLRLSIKAIEKLSKEKSKRKILTIFSDGEFEDNAYALKDVIKKARSENITILSVGYRDSINLQSIRKLAEENSGKIWIANKTTHKLSKNFQNEFLAYIGNGGAIEILKDSIPPNQSLKQTITLEVLTDSNETFQTTFILPTKAPIVKKEVKEESNKTLFIILAIAILVLIVLFILFKKKNRNKEEDEKILFGWLESISGEKYFIYKISNSIGSLETNDIVIKGELISRNHAILEFKDGKFYIIDRNSTNGVFLNGKKTTQSELNENDRISFGPFEVTFYINFGE